MCTYICLPHSSPEEMTVEFDFQVQLEIRSMVYTQQIEILHNSPLNLVDEKFTWRNHWKAFERKNIIIMIGL